MARKIVNINVDTIKSTYSSIATFKQLDAVTLNVNVCENGVAKDLTGQTIKLYIRREDRSVLEQLDGIRIVDIVNGEIEIKLKNSALNCQGNVFCELEFEDLEGTITSSDFIFLVKSKVNHADVIMNTSELSVLKQIEVYVIQAKKDLEVFRNSLAGLNDLVANKDNLLRENAEARTNITSLDTKNNAATTNISNLDSKNNTATTKIRDLETNISTATTKNTELTNTTVSAEASKNALELAIEMGDIETIKEDVKKLTDEVVQARTDFWGKTHESLKAKEDSDFQFQHIDNSKGMFLEQKGVGSLTVKNTLEGSVRNLKILGNTVGGYDPETSTSFPLSSVGEAEGGKISILSTGKNLFNQGDSFNASSKIRVNVDDWVNLEQIENGVAFVQSKNIELKVGEIYTIKSIAEKIATTNVYNLKVRIAYWDGSEYKTIGYAVGETGSYNLTVTEGRNIISLGIYTNDANIGEGMGNKARYKIMLSHTQNNDNYYPYIEDKKDILLPATMQGMNAIGTVKDEYDDTTNEVIQRIGSREYRENDENDIEVLTDKNITLYKLENPIIHKLEPSKNLSTFKPLTTVSVESEVPGAIEGKFPVEVGGVLTDLQEENAILRKNQVELTERFIRKIEDMDQQLARMNNAKI